MTPPGDIPEPVVVAVGSSVWHFPGEHNKDMRKTIRALAFHLCAAAAQGMPTTPDPWMLNDEHAFNASERAAMAHVAADFQKAFTKTYDPWPQNVTN